MPPRKEPPSIYPRERYRSGTDRDSARIGDAIRREMGHGPTPLRRRRIGGAQLAVAGFPDAAYAAACANKQSRGSEGDESHQQRVLDQILTLFVPKEIRESCHRGHRIGGRRNLKAAESQDKNL